jgi:hypothetical protein
MQSPRCQSASVSCPFIVNVKPRLPNTLNAPVLPCTRQYAESTQTSGPRQGTSGSLPQELHRKGLSAAHRGWESRRSTNPNPKSPAPPPQSSHVHSRKPQRTTLRVRPSLILNMTPDCFCFSPVSSPIHYRARYSTINQVWRKATS